MLLPWNFRVSFRSDLHEQASILWTMCVSVSSADKIPYIASCCESVTSWCKLIFARNCVRGTYTRALIYTHIQYLTKATCQPARSAHTLSLSPSNLTHTHTHTHTHAVALSLSHTHTLSLPLLHTHTHALSPSLAHTHAHARSLSLSCTHTRTHTRTSSLSLTHTHTHARVRIFLLFCCDHNVVEKSVLAFLDKARRKVPAESAVPTPRAR